MRIIFSREAISDLKRLRQFIAIHNPTAANRVASHLRDAINQLLEFPFIGMQIKNERGIPLRELIVDKYMVSYTVTDETIHILQIWHGKEKR